MPKLSIIIPTFNSAATMQKCLCSIASQTFTDYEVVIQDGMSSDETIELIREFQRNNPEVRIELEQEPDRMLRIRRMNTERTGKYPIQ